MRRPEADTKEMADSYVTSQPVCLEAAREKGMGRLWGSHRECLQREGIQMLVHKTQLNGLQ